MMPKNLKDTAMKTKRSGPPKGTLPPNTRHRMTGSKEYEAWLRIRLRCYKTSYHSYKYYGARGIKVCDRWLKSFENFLEDMGHSPSPKHTLDRIDNDGDYTPENCRWATWTEQNNNKRNVKLYEYNGESHSIRAWSRIVGIKNFTIQWRLKNGWTIEQALTIKSDTPQHHVGGRYIPKVKHDA